MATLQRPIVQFTQAGGPTDVAYAPDLDVVLVPAGELTVAVAQRLLSIGRLRALREADLMPPLTG